MRTIRLALAVLFVAAALVLIAYPVFADAVYHAEHLALTPAAGCPLRSGFVENIHVNGPIVYAHENYVLNGALPYATFDVYLFVYADPACTIGPVAWYPTASVSTNVAGNGQAQAVMPPESIPPELQGATIGGRWEVRQGTTVAYATQCTTIVLD